MWAIREALAQTKCPPDHFRMGAFGELAKAIDSLRNDGVNAWHAIGSNYAGLLPDQHHSKDALRKKTATMSKLQAR